MTRNATVARKTKETDIEISVDTAIYIDFIIAVAVSI